jgi:hypothetical protein
MKKTAWFPAHIKPVHEGVYETRFISQATCRPLAGFSTWTGSEWSFQMQHTQCVFMTGSRAFQETAWFPAHIKPVRDGVYETRFLVKSCRQSLYGFSVWDGVQWSNQSNKEAWCFFDAEARQDKEWRGVKK